MNLKSCTGPGYQYLLVISKFIDFDKTKSMQFEETFMKKQIFFFS